MRKKSFIVAISGDFKRTIIDNRSRHATAIGEIVREDEGTWRVIFRTGVGTDGFANEFRAARYVISMWKDYADDDSSAMLPGEDMDGDHASALASAGFGTDEDYGYYWGNEDDNW